MADENTIQELNSAITVFQKLDFDKFLRPELGKLSLKDDLGQLFKDLNARLDTAVVLAKGVGNNPASNLKNVIGGFHSVVESTLNRNNEQYSSDRPSIITKFKQQLDQFEEYWPYFIISQLVSSGILQTDYNIKDSGKKIIQEAKEEAAKIKKRAMDAEKASLEKIAKTARGISVKVAQVQFREAQKDIKIQVIIWITMSIFSSFMLYLVIKYFFSLKPESLSLYFTAVRISALVGLGAFVTFCLKMLKSSLYMFNRNLHRQRVTNSIEAFVEAALTNDQKDLILAQLVDSVISFRASDKDSDSIHPQKMIIDNIIKKVSSSSHQPG